MLIKPEDVLKELAKRRDEPVEQLRIVMMDFFQQLLMYLQHPQDNYLKGILIQNCCKFRLNPKRVLTTTKNVINKPFRNNHYHNVMDVHEQLLKYGQYTQRQEEIATNIKRDEPRPSRQERDNLHE
ncbi:MAG TPA: hypothetical protein PLG47_02920 [Candidatus Dojkabacteria bacterium]|nr:hypothetical protein [Candidatus Dojkabacteria bacterium]